jgi:hypothetical protein
MSEYIEIAGFEDKTPKNITMVDVAEYLNTVLILHGPPCEYCVHFDYNCSKKYRPRKRLLKFGPFEYWHLRKYCKEFKGKEETTKTLLESTKKFIDGALDCFNQTYG